MGLTKCQEGWKGKNLWQRKPSLASGLRPHPWRFTVINSDVVDNNYYNNIFMFQPMQALTNIYGGDSSENIPQSKTSSFST